MNINIVLRGVELNSDEQNLLRKQAQALLGGLSHGMESVDLVLEDFNGPREGDDQVCRLILRRTSEPATILQQRGETAVAVGLAALERAGRLVHRREEKAVVRHRSAAAFN